MKTLRITLAAAALVAVGLATARARADGEAEAADRWFVWRIEGAPAGFIHLRRERTDDAEAPVRLVQRVELVQRKRALSVRLTLDCRDDELLTPVRIKSEASGAEAASFEASVREGKLRAAIPGRELELPVAERFATFFGVFELVERRPFEKEKVLAFDCLEAFGLDYKKGHTLTYAGEETVALPDGERRLHRFDHAGRGIRGGSLWVDGEHRLQRVVFDGRKEITRATEEAAKAALAEAKARAKD